MCNNAWNNILVVLHLFMYSCVEVINNPWFSENKISFCFHLNTLSSHDWTLRAALIWFIWIHHPHSHCVCGHSYSYSYSRIWFHFPYSHCMRAHLYPYPYRASGSTLCCCVWTFASSHHAPSIVSWLFNHWVLSYKINGDSHFCWVPQPLHKGSRTLLLLVSLSSST